MTFCKLLLYSVTLVSLLFTILAIPAWSKEDPFKYVHQYREQYPDDPQKGFRVDRRQKDYDFDKGGGLVEVPANSHRVYSELYTIEYKHPKKVLHSFALDEGATRMEAHWSQVGDVTLLALDVIRGINGDNVYIFAMTPKKLYVIRTPDIEYIKELLRSRVPDLSVDRFHLHTYNLEGKTVHMLFYYRKGAEEMELPVDVTVDENFRGTVNLGEYRKARDSLK